MIGRIGFVELLIIPVMFAIPAVILYFIIKIAVKNAIKESKGENTL